MQHSIVPLQGRYIIQKQSSLPLVTRNRTRSKRSGTISTRSPNTPGSSLHSGHRERFLYPCNNPEKNVTLPVVTTQRHCTEADRTCNNNDGECSESTPEMQKSSSDVVIVQLFTEKYYNIHRDVNNNLLEPSRSCGVRSPHSSSPHQKAKFYGKNTKQIGETLLDGSLSRASTQNFEAKCKQRLDATGSGFTQTELKIHTDREKQKSNVFLLDEQERSKRIVEDWLKTLPH